MPPPEAARELIAAQLRTVLAAINATTEPTKYWYTPTKVLRVDIHDVRYLRTKLPDDTDVDLLYLLMPGDGFVEEETSGSLQKRSEWWLLVAKKWAPASQDPYHLESNPPLKETIQSRLIRDVEVKLNENVTLGDRCFNCEVRDENLITIEDIGPWAAVELRILVTYHPLKTAP